MEPHQLDQRPDLGLGSEQENGPAVGAEPASQDSNVQHQRGVGEHELGQVDDDIGLSPDGPGQRGPPEPLGVAILITAAAQSGRFVIEVDDRATLINVAAGRHANLAKAVERFPACVGQSVGGIFRCGHDNLDTVVDSPTWQLLTKSPTRCATSSILS
jgi:hypothetical protein